MCTLGTWQCGTILLEKFVFANNLARPVLLQADMTHRITGHDMTFMHARIGCILHVVPTHVYKPKNKPALFQGIWNSQLIRTIDRWKFNKPMSVDHPGYWNNWVSNFRIFETHQSTLWYKPPIILKFTDIECLDYNWTVFAW